MSSFHHFKVFPLGFTLRTRKGLTQIFGNDRCPILSNSTLRCNEVLERPRAIDMAIDRAIDMRPSKLYIEEKQTELEVGSK